MASRSLPSSSASGRAGPALHTSSATFGGAPMSDTRSHSCSAFLAGDVSIRIVPNFNYKGTIGLVSRPVGPFRAGVDTSVPLWLGVMLRRRNLAQIKVPEWMDVGRLKAVLQFERDPNKATFSPDLPFRHAEIARAVLSACGTGSGSGGGVGEEIPHADQIRILLEDISSVRMDKIRRNIHTLSAQTLSRKAPLPIIDVTGIGSLEMQAIRPFVTACFRDHGALIKESAERPGVGALESRDDALRRRLSTGRSRDDGVAEERMRGREAGTGEEGGMQPPVAPPTSNGRSRIRRFR